MTEQAGSGTEQHKTVIVRSGSGPGTPEVYHLPDEEGDRPRCRLASWDGIEWDLRDIGRVGHKGLCRWCDPDVDVDHGSTGDTGIGVGGPQ